jgi:hypothetical protein
LAKKILYLFKNKIIYNYMIFVATKKDMGTNFLRLSFVAVFGTGNRDPRSGIRKKNHSGFRVKKAPDPGSGSATMITNKSSLSFFYSQMFSRLDGTGIASVNQSTNFRVFSDFVFS